MILTPKDTEQPALHWTHMENPCSYIQHSTTSRFHKLEKNSIRPLPNIMRHKIQQKKQLQQKTIKKLFEIPRARMNAASSLFRGKFRFHLSRFGRTTFRHQPRQQLNKKVPSTKQESEFNIRWRYDSLTNYLSDSFICFRLRKNKRKKGTQHPVQMFLRANSRIWARKHQFLN